MIATGIISFVAGAVLAQRFRILALLPLIALAGFAALIAFFAGGANAWYFVLMALVAAVSLQLGYLAGATFRAWETVGHDVAERMPVAARLTAAGKHVPAIRAVAVRRTTIQRHL